MVDFETKDEELYVDGRKVDQAWESITGWYWFGVERAYKQDSVIRGEVYEDDQIWYGYVQGHEDEWGYFSEAELERLAPKVWRIDEDDLPHAGRGE